jgi:hypothetical protein
MDIKKAAQELGRKGGSVKSEKKAAAVRENGKKGGRPAVKISKTITTHIGEVEVTINPEGTPVQIGNQLWKAFAYYTRTDRVKWSQEAAKAFRADGYDFEYTLPAYS